MKKQSVMGLLFCVSLTQVGNGSAAQTSNVLLAQTSNVLLAQTGNPEVVKNYLLERIAAQKTATATLSKAAKSYYGLAKAQQFIYTKISATQARSTLQAARAAWSAASPVYESIEGIVAGVEMLASFDLNLDAGSSAKDGGDAVVEFDLKLPNGKVLPKPGNAFGVLEATLWGTDKGFSSGVKFDFNNNGKIEFGDHLPNADVLQAAADKLDELTEQLLQTAKKWNPSSKVFGALVANVPTASSVFIERWKTSRFVLGEQSTQRDFNVISSLNDLVQNVTSWQQLYRGVQAGVAGKNAALDTQIQSGLTSLKSWAQKLEASEKTRRFTPEQAEIIAKEGENRATALVGRISQAAALVGVKL
jgi:hypothetical protein